MWKMALLNLQDTWTIWKAELLNLRSISTQNLGFIGWLAPSQALEQFQTSRGRVAFDAKSSIGN
jgi:hypothetical protein